MYKKSRAWVELNLENLKHNVGEFRRLLPSNCALMPAVKANAYGHGALLVAKALQEQGIRAFCVASVREGIELRQAGITGELLVLGYTHPSQFDDLIAYHLIQTVVDGDYAQEMKRDGRRFTVHVGIDTEMHRLGERWENVEEIVKIFQIPNLEVTGVYSHLCVSDGKSEEQRAYTMDQMLVDVTAIPRVKAGEEAVLIGKSGSLEIRAEDVAQWTGTISNEIVSRLGERLERVAGEFPSPPLW